MFYGHMPPSGFTTLRSVACGVPGTPSHTVVSGDERAFTNRLYSYIAPCATRKTLQPGVRSMPTTFVQPPGIGDIHAPFAGQGLTINVRWGSAPTYSRLQAYHAARPDCEPRRSPDIGPSVGSPARAVASTEDAPEEIGMCLEDAGASWTTYLRVPEIPDLGNLRLRSLRSGAVEVDAGGTQHRLSLMELRPGIGAARLAVPPAATSYKVSPKGDWPSAIAQEPWQGSARGLNPRGTLFRLRRGEWVRLKEGSAILNSEREIASGLGVSRNAPPSGCLPEAANVVTHSRVSWRMWRVVLPTASTASLERWAEDLGVVVREAAWKISLINVPQAFDDEEQIPVFGTKNLPADRQRVREAVHGSPPSSDGGDSRGLIKPENGGAGIERQCGSCCLHRLR